jgi:hypothetical protein
MNIISSQAGQAVVIRDPRAVPMLLSFDNWGGFVVRNCILQGIAVSTRGNFQFMHTLRGFVYVYVFGERMGSVVVNGMAFQGRCPADNTNGLEQIMQYYGANRISATGAPVGIAIGSARFRGFLTATSFQILNPLARIGQFSLNFDIIPT